MTEKFSEKSLVEDYILEKMEEKGWRAVAADELERESYAEPLLIPALIRAVKKINKNIGIGDEEVARVINDLKLTGTGQEGAKRILNVYKFGVPIKFEKDKVVRYVQLFDYNNPGNNEFIASRQVHYDGRERIRTDIVLYVNGIPLVNIECKNPVSIAESWYTAYKDIKGYERTVPELYKYVQIGVAAEAVARYFPIVPWQEEVKASEWKDDEEGKGDSLDSTCVMLSSGTLLDIIRSFLFFRIERGDATKVITRYMQYRAANKMVNRVLDNLKGTEVKDKGLIWHWQGSGKTLTMIFAANKLFHALGNPTIFFIVDRVELEEQLSREFNSLDIIKPEVIGSVGELEDVLRHDDYRGKRGVFITLIHKFRPGELDEVHDELEAVSKRKETVMTRKDIVAFIDEGHRSQYGLLAGTRDSILKSAFFFALTGTPISKKGRDTYQEFSYPPEEPYLDRYFITDSIRDGFTVKIVYQPRLEKEVHLKKADLDAFLKSGFDELPEEIRGPVEERVKKRMNAIKLILENPERIRAIAEDIARHFKENVDGRFKAMVVAGSRAACEIYHQELRRHFPEEYLDVVMTYGKEDTGALQELAAESLEKYGQSDTKEMTKRAVERFTEEDFPRILIVTEMLLTGFDAPVLQVMYLDKLLKEHRLLQAVARTNRPYKDVKEAGLVIDYVGILKEFTRALEMYSVEDITGALVAYEGLRGDFTGLIRELRGMFGGLPMNHERGTLLRAVEVLTTDGAREKGFLEKYEHLRKTFELLGPDEVKREYFEEYTWLTAVHTYYMKMVAQKSPDEAYVRKYFEKTVRFVHQTTEIEKLMRDLPSMELGEGYLTRLEEKVRDRREKAANILFALNKLVLVERHMNPVYESLAGKVERLLSLWREKTRDYDRIYSEGVDVLKEIDALQGRQKALGFSDLEYALLLVLEQGVGQRDDMAKEVKEIAQGLGKSMFTGWAQQMTAKKEVEREIRRFTRGLKGRFNLSLEEIDNLHGKLMESVRNYGAS